MNEDLFRRRDKSPGPGTGCPVIHRQGAPMAAPSLAGLRVAIVHYWFLEMPRGGERVIDALLEVFPQADIFTNIFDRDVFSGLASRHKITTSFIDHLPIAKRAARYYLPFMPIALEQFDLSQYDLVISSESGPAKAVIVPDHCVHICYCHSPMRYIWNKYAEYQNWSPFLLKLPLALAAHYLRLVDYASAARVDHFIANSHAVARRIEKYYRREARVVFPPVDVSAFSPRDGSDDFYLYCGELTRYKRPDLAVDCFNELGLPLRIIGGGEMAAVLQRRARQNIDFLGRASNEKVRENLARCKALIFPGEEDFGIVPVEAMASGRPVIALARGGALDTIVAGVTGVFFDEPSVAGLAAAVLGFQQQEGEFNPSVIAAHAAKFDKRRFIEQMGEIVSDALRTAPPLPNEFPHHRF